MSKSNSLFILLLFVFVFIVINDVVFLARKWGWPRPIGSINTEKFVRNNTKLLVFNKWHELEKINSTDLNLKNASKQSLAAGKVEQKHAKSEHSVRVEKKCSFHAVTYASHTGSDERFCMAMESAARHKINLTILGWGVPWRGLFQKLEAAMILAESVPSDDVILFVDAFDVLFTNASSQVVPWPHSLGL